MTASVSDAAGNPATATDTAALDTSAAITVSLDDVNSGNAAAAPIAGTTTGVEAGQTVTLAITDGTGTVTVTATVNSDGSYSTTGDLSGLADGPLTVTASVSDAAGNPATATDTAALDTTAAMTVSLDDVNSGNVAAAPITGTTAGVEAGQTVTLVITDGTATVTRAGNTPYDYNKEKASLASIALDYRGDKLRLYANLNYEYQHMDAPIFSNWRPANASVPVPRAPDARTNPSPPWTFTETERSYHVVRAEYDLSEHWTASLAHGWNDVNETQLVAYGRTLINAAGDVTEPTANRFIPTQRDNSATDFKLSGHLQTGAVSHQVALGLYRSVQDSDYTLKLVGGKGSISNIYNLTYNYPLLLSYCWISRQECPPLR